MHIPLPFQPSLDGDASKVVLVDMLIVDAYLQSMIIAFDISDSS